LNRKEIKEVKQVAKINTKNAQEACRVVVVSPNKKRATGYVIRTDGVVLKRQGNGYIQKFKIKTDLNEYLKRCKEHAEKTGREYRWGETEPTFDTCMKWEYDGVAEAIDGCRVEPDGTCPHGYVSWLVAKGMI